MSDLKPVPTPQPQPQAQQQWYDAIPDETFDDAIDADAPLVVTSNSLRCGGSRHPTHIVLFSTPASVAWNATLQEAQRLGWTYDGERRAWLCPVCSAQSYARKG